MSSPTTRCPPRARLMMQPPFLILPKTLPFKTPFVCEVKGSRQTSASLMEATLRRSVEHLTPSIAFGRRLQPATLKPRASSLRAASLPSSPSPSSPTVRSAARYCLCRCQRRSCCCARRSEEHTSELQSRSDLVCRLLLEKKKNNTHKTTDAQ